MKTMLLFSSAAALGVALAALAGCGPSGCAPVGTGLNTNTAVPSTRCRTGTFYDPPTKNCLEKNGIGQSSFDGNASRTPFRGNWNVLEELPGGLQKVSQGGNLLAYDPKSGFARPWDIYESKGAGVLDPNLIRWGTGPYTYETLEQHELRNKNNSH